MGECFASAPLVLPHTGRLQSEPTGATRDGGLPLSPASCGGTSEARAAGWPGLRLCEGPEGSTCHAGSRRDHPPSVSLIAPSIRTSTRERCPLPSDALIAEQSATLASHSPAPAGERLSSKLCFAVRGRTPLSSISRGHFVSKSRSWYLQEGVGWHAAKRSFGDMRSQAGAWDRGSMCSSLRF